MKWSWPYSNSPACGTLERKMTDKVTGGRKRIDLLHDITEDRDYGQLKDLVLDRSRWRQDEKSRKLTKKKNIYQFTELPVKHSLR